MKKLLLIVFVAFASILTAQVESELGFKYMKAKYLLETKRYQEAIKAFTEILDEDKTYEDAKVYRAEAKYEIADHRGAITDIASYIANKGATKKALSILGSAQKGMKNIAAADKTMDVVNQLNGAAPSPAAKSKKVKRKKVKTMPEPSSKYEDEESGLFDDEEETERSTSNPSKSSKIQVIPNTSGSRDQKSKVKNTKVLKPNTTSTSEDREESRAPKDDTKKTVTIDEDLYLTIYGDGLGKRKIMDQPNILILSDTDGTVAVDICVNHKGKVIEANINKQLSTLTKEHLRSLALRKAKEFWFERSDYKKACGVIVFNITKI